MKQSCWKRHRRSVVGSCDGFSDIISSEEEALKEVTTVAQMNAKSAREKEDREKKARQVQVIVPGQQDWLNQHLASESTSTSQPEPSMLLSLLPGVNRAINNKKLLIPPVCPLYQ